MAYAFRVASGPSCSQVTRCLVRSPMNSRESAEAVLGCLGWLMGENGVLKTLSRYINHLVAKESARFRIEPLEQGGESW
jgi:hypothetical protein